MRHTTDYGLSSPTRVVRSPRVEGGSPAVYGLLAVSAFLGFVIVPGGGLLAALMVLAACGWVVSALLSAAGSLIKRLVVAAPAGVGRRQADEPGRVADSSPPLSPSFSQGEPARSEV